jgi:murein L,D-transpeptidase YafK
MLLSMSLSGAAADVDSGTTLRHPAPLIAVESRGDPYPGYMVLVDKQRQRLHLWEVKDGRFSEVFSVACSTGEAAGRKARSGDKKTPEGVYFFTKEHPDRDLAPIYGSRAFPIDYPNFMDRLAGRGGNSIWLHGTNKKLKPRDSNGCIVVENSAIDRLAGYITLHRTPIIIVGKLRASDGSAVQPIRQAVSAVLSGWRSALADGSYHDYLRHYDADFLPDIGWWREWTRQRGRMAAERAAVSVALENTGIYRHGSLYTVLFDQYLRSPFEAVFIGTRKLFLKEGADGFRIVGDVDQSLAEPLKGAKPGHALVAACRNLKTRDAEAEIAAVVDDWLEAWSSQDIDRYASFYARDFRSQGGADLNTWIDYKDRLNRKYRFIRVTRNKKMTIERGKRHSTVSFVQTYASNVFKTTGVKKLILKREGNRWKIYREIFNQI